MISGCTYGPKAEQTPLPTETITANAVEIKDFAFNPATITILKGTTVTWTNKDGVQHTITGKSFDSGRLNNGQIFSHIFNETGTFEYSCSIHQTMRGKVIVTE